MSAKGPGGIRVELDRGEVRPAVMTEVTAGTVARILRRDLGLDAGIRYAERIAWTAKHVGHGESAAVYLEAADTLRGWRDGTERDPWRARMEEAR